MDSNTVVIGALTLRGLRSDSGGTLLRFIVPDRVPSGGEAPPMLWLPGDYTVTVAHAAGKSRAVSLVVRNSR